MVSETTARARSLKLWTGESNSHLIVDYLPERYDTVIIHCELFQCLGYIDEKRIWRNQSDNKPVDGRVLAWARL